MNNIGFILFSYSFNQYKNTVTGLNVFYVFGFT